MDVSTIAAVARRQHGLITKSQLLVSLSEHQLKRALRDRRIEPVRRGVYRLAGAPETWIQHVLAACMAGGPRAHASFSTAAALFGLDGFGRDLIEIMHLGERPSLIEGVRSHESAVVSPLHVAIVSAVPVTSVARTLCDLTAAAPKCTVERAVDEALRRKIVTLRRLAAVATDLDGPGRRRCTVMREILGVRLPGYHPGESEPEKRIAGLLERAIGDRPVAQHRIRLGRRTLRVDLAYPDRSIAIEYDSDAFHLTKSAHDNDARRRNELRLAGWTVIELTSGSSKREIVDVVARAIARASAS